MGIYRRGKTWRISYAVGSGRRDEPASPQRVIAERLLELRLVQVKLGILHEPGDQSIPGHAIGTTDLELVKTVAALTEELLSQREQMASISSAIEQVSAMLDQLLTAPPARAPKEPSAMGEALPRYLNAEQAAEYLATSTRALYARVARGAVPSRKVGRRLLFDRVALDRWIAKAPGVSVRDALRDS